MQPVYRSTVTAVLWSKLKGQKYKIEQPSNRNFGHRYLK